MEREVHTQPNPRPLASAPTSALFGRLIRGFSALVRKEVELARAEIDSDVKATMTKFASLAVAGACGFLALTLFCAAAVLGLATLLPAWLAALAVGVAMLAIAGIAVAVAKAKDAEKPLDQTQRTLKEDVRWAKERVA